MNKATVRDLATSLRRDDKLNVIVVGKTGCGARYIGAALAQARDNHAAARRSAGCLDSSTELAITRADGSYTRVLAKLAKTEVLVLDDFSGFPAQGHVTRKWHAALGDPTVGRPPRAQCPRPVAHWPIHPSGSWPDHATTPSARIPGTDLDLITYAGF